MNPWIQQKYDNILFVADQTKYPKFTKYIRYSFPKLIKIPKIVSNVSKYGGLTHAEFKEAISWGKGFEKNKVSSVDKNKAGKSVYVIGATLAHFKLDTRRTMSLGKL